MSDRWRRIFAQNIEYFIVVEVPESELEALGNRIRFISFKKAVWGVIGSGMHEVAYFSDGYLVIEGRRIFVSWVDVEGAIRDLSGVFTAYGIRGFAVVYDVVTNREVDEVELPL